MRWIFTLFILMQLIAGCSASQHKSDEASSDISHMEYTQLVKKYTSRTDQYSGFYQTFQADMTMQSTELQTAALRQKSEFMQWTAQQFQAEREKVIQESSAYSRFFLRFYSPEKEYDDLHKGKTIWKVFLEYGGNRFEGKVSKLTTKFVELQTLYPHLDRFSTPYEISFNVPMSTIEQGASKVILSSSLGSAEFRFPTQK